MLYQLFENGKKTNLAGKHLSNEIIMMELINRPLLVKSCFHWTVDRGTLFSTKIWISFEPIQKVNGIKFQA